MGILDRMRGLGGSSSGSDTSSSAGADTQAIERYRYMLRTAPPEAIEQAHAEAFAKLTPEQRRMLLAQLRSETPEAERVLASRDGDDPQALARLATRAEVRQPGTLERVYGRTGGMPGFGGMIAGSLLGSMAGTVLGTMIAQNFLGADDSGHAGAQTTEASTHDDSFTQADDSSADFGGGDVLDV